jgi:hypothetical protein
MPDQHFLNKQELIGVPVMKAVGVIEKEYQPVELQVGVVQVTETKDANGKRDFELKAGAYGIGVPLVAEDPLGLRPDMSVWTMQLQPDADPEKGDFTPGLAFGFVLVRLKGGGFTGWIDEVELTGIQTSSGA